MRRRGPPAQPSGDTVVASLVSVNIGMPRDVSWRDKTVFTGVWKQPVHGPQMVRRLNIDGDGQGDRSGHGGEQRAVLVYQLESYSYWQRHFGRDDFSHGEFGENFTVDGLPDDQVCIGDRYRIGDAEFEVTQPRVTCYRVGMRVGEPELPSLLVSHHRPGFYMRVISEGVVQAGDAIIKTRAGPGALSVADADALLYLPDRDPAQLLRALDIPALSPGWKQSFRELQSGQGDGRSPSESSSPTEPAWTGFRPLRVADVVAETATVSSIYLTNPDSELPTALPGQYVTLRIAQAALPAVVRSYSLSDALDTGRYRISVKREPKGIASNYLHTLRAGVTIDVAAPRGDFVLGEGTSPVMLISAGIGVTPVLAMLHSLSSRRDERDIWWIHGARGRDEHAFANEAHTLLGALLHTHEHIYYSDATDNDRQQAHALPGRITRDELDRLAVPTDADAYVCGPTVFMADIRQALVAIGIDPSHIHTEQFGVLSSINPGITGGPHRVPHLPEGPIGTGPLVTFARSGIATPFDTSRTTLLDLADACDISTRWSCRTGVCHTCVTGLLAGTVSYRPTPLEAPADADVLICCAQPTTDVILDM